MKTLITAALFTVVAATAQAQSYDYGSSSSSCSRPTVSFSSSQSPGYGGGDVTTTFNASVNFTIGGMKGCELQEATDRDQSIRSAYETIKVRAQAEKEQVSAILEKLKICSEFTSETAPNSIQAFCGDLLGVDKIDATATTSSSYNY